MASLRDIRRKIHSAGNIRKITGAMELVAASRLRKAQAKAEASRPYAKKLKEILDKVVAGSDDLTHPLIIPREVKKIGLVIIAADRGLCGAYNQNAFNAAEKFLQAQSAEVEIIPVGKKAVDHFRAGKWKVFSEMQDWGGKILYPQIEEFTEVLMNAYLQNELDEIHLLYTHFVHIGVREIRIEKLLSLEPEAKEPLKEQFIFEPDPSELFAELLPNYCITKVQNALNDAYASELAARISSMRSATKNAGEMIEKLTMLRNKIRQYGITKELIEITSGAEGLR